MKKLLLLLVLTCSIASAEEFSSAMEEGNYGLISMGRVSKDKSSTMSTEMSTPIQEETKKVEPVEVVDSNSSLRIGGSYSYLWMTPKANPTFSGSLGGAQGIYEYRPKNCIYQGVKFSWRQGDTTQGLNTRSLLDFNVHQRIGYTFDNLFDRMRATLFTGLGYRYLGHELKQPGQNNLEFNYNELYVPVGLLVDRKVGSYLTLGLNVTWMPQVYPAVTIIPLNGADWIINKTIENFIVSAPITFNFSRCGHFTLELTPFFEYWKDGKTSAASNLGVDLDIPENTYLFCGAELNLGYLF